MTDKQPLNELGEAKFKLCLSNRIKILDEIILKSQQSGIDIHGKLTLVDFLKRIYPSLDNMPSTDGRFQTAAEDITQHMIRNSDWTYHKLFNNYFDLPNSSDEVFIKFLEIVTHPIVQEADIQGEFANLINNHLIKDGFRLEAKEEMSGLPLYRAVKIGSGVSGNIKNLIFAANGAKPELVLEDAINNDIRIVKNEEFCLVYDKTIPNTGLLWKDLVSWWAKEANHETATRETEDSLYNRLLLSLASTSPPEKLLFETYYGKFRDKFGESLPALIPQVYLHYDPYTLRQLPEKRLPRQRMDFLILFSHQERVVIEVDGKKHYADDNIASPKKYSEMVAEDRKLKLAGYEVYRFGGYELHGEPGKCLVENFFDKLIQKYIKDAK